MQASTHVISTSAEDKREEDMSYLGRMLDELSGVRERLQTQIARAEAITDHVFGGAKVSETGGDPRAVPGGAAGRLHAEIQQLDDDVERLSAQLDRLAEL